MLPLEVPDWLSDVFKMALAGAPSYYLGRREANAKAKKSELENVEKAVGIWQNTAERLEKRVEQMQANIDALQKRIDELEKENKNLHKELLELRKSSN